MNESNTKAELIEPALRAAGWGVVEGTRIHREYPVTKGRLIGQGRRKAPLFADYVLYYKGQRLAVIEAKARDKYYTEGLPQAKDYAERLRIRYTYATNGDRIRFVDMSSGIESDVDGYPSPEELWNMVYPQPKTPETSEIANWEQRFFDIPFETRGGFWNPRYYQENAIEAVLKAIARKEQRALLTLATGTGKTAIAFQIAWKLFQSHWNIQRDGARRPRILFLADRNILADQAFNSFGAFEEDALVRIRPDEIKKDNRVPKNGHIFFTIFQTFMSGPDETPYFGQYPQDFFDFIIIDECHRGGAKDESQWRAILEYFSPAVQLGLTATPKRDVNGDTYKYFGEPVYQYSLKEGIEDGFLTPFRLKEVSSNIDSYQYTASDKVISGEIDEQRTYGENDFNRIIESRDREKHRVQLLMQHIIQSQKTLVFCATQRHAAMVRDLINELSESMNANYCHRVTADDGGIGEQHLRDFQDNEKSIPTILTTSRKLSTGVDAPEVRNIVLLRPVKSMVEFKQIVGRGTRLFDGKDYFTIYDFCNNHYHFKDPEWDGDPLEPEEAKPRKKREGYSKPEELFDEDDGLATVDEDEVEIMTEVEFGDGTRRRIRSDVKTSFYGPNGEMISAVDFLKLLFKELPELLKDEAELRRIWSLPSTRRKLLEELAEKGYSSEQLEELQDIVDGKESDLFDVLAYVAYNSEMQARAHRAERAKIHFDDYDPAQQEFLDFVLSNYVKKGIEELDDERLSKLLKLKYDSIADAKEALGDPVSIRKVFVGFQGYLYDDVG
jgi:type I restriction enzyme R subunit